MRIIPTTGGQRTPLELLVEALDKAHIVALLADRDLSARGSTWNSSVRPGCRPVQRFWRCVPRRRCLR